MECFHVFIDIGLIDLAVAIADVINEVLDKNIVKSLIGIIEFSIVYGFDGIGNKVNSNAADVL